MNWLKFLVGLSALIIAGCAAYFSVTGLGVLFAGASVSVMVMASALELAKLVAATYLKQKWDEIGGFNKWYLTTSVAVLMLITSAGIFGYLSNAFQAQSLQLQQVDREIAVHQTKIDQNTAQITQLSTQITEFNTNQGKILDGGKVNSRLIRSIDNRDKQISKINDKISDLQTENAGETEKINEIKIKNLDLEKEVGGFRFVAEAFGMELKNVVKFFIFLIVIVFDPLAVALIIAFNGLIEDKKKKQREILTEMMENDQKLGLYEVYGDIKEDIVENISQNIEDSGKNSPIEEETEILKENIRIPIDCDGDGIIDGYDTNGDGMIDEWKEIGPRNGIIPYYAKPEFNWNNKNAWINDQNAVNFWLNSKGGTFRELTRIKNENDNIKTY
jgi:cell division protein FtsL